WGLPWSCRHQPIPHSQQIHFKAPTSFNPKISQLNCITDPSAFPLHLHKFLLFPMAVVDLHNSSDSSFEYQPTKLESNWSSPSSSTVSESDQGAPDDDDYIAELTRQMAHYMLQDFDDPQQFQDEADYMNKQENSTVVPQISPVSEFQKKQALIDEQIRSVQLNRVKQERERKRQAGEKQSNGNKKGRGNRGKNRALLNGSPPLNDNNNKGQTAWWSQQQSIRTAAAVAGSPEVRRAVFLGDSGKASTTGTGVFLPRGVGNSTTTAASADSRKKPGCSTVLIPARVVQALKLHFDKMSTVAAPTINPPPSAAAAATLPLQHDAVMGDVRYAFQLQEQKSQSPTKPAAARNQHRNLRHHNHQYQDMGLPQEWTY
ncbi:hypothetical protein LINPERHAP2_LOCUS17691, partial [Linum perenne]